VQMPTTHANKAAHVFRATAGILLHVLRSLPDMKGHGKAQTGGK